MRYPDGFLDEIRNRLPLSEVVRRRVQLKKAGREWKGLSPFNKEKTPSFYVNDQKNLYKCFSSGKHGDQFTFVMETEGLSFPEAVERLAEQAGVALPKLSREAEQRFEKSRTLHDVCELAAKFFQAQLQERVGARARGYLAGRELGASTQVKFRLGYAPADRFALKEHLGKQGVSVADMCEAGLLIHGPDIAVPYDRFRDRVMFPIGDLRGRVVAFGGRALEKDVPAKYLNSPETPLFHKGSLLYNAHGAREAAHKTGRVIAVEGYVDVIAMSMAGLAETVAPLGTALTAEQLELLWRMAAEPVLLFDGDAAGQRAAFRAVDVALPLIRPGRSLRFATLPGGQDPDDLIRAQGRAAMDEVLAQARPLADVVWSRETQAGLFETPEKRAALETRLAELIASIHDETVRRHYRDALMGRLAEAFQTPHSRRRGRQNPALTANLSLSASLSSSALVRGPRAAIAQNEALIVLCLIHHPWLIDKHMEDIAKLDFRHPEIEAMKRAILDLHLSFEGETIDYEVELDRQNYGPLRARIMRAVTAPAVWGAGKDVAPADVEVTWDQLVALQNKRQALAKELRELERALAEDIDAQEADEALATQNLARLRDVQAQISAIDRSDALIEGFGAQSGRR